ncbi:MAG: hypothetical protein ACREBG_03290 [Pyrinomonadaceae bacterium]
MAVCACLLLALAVWQRVEPPPAVKADPSSLSSATQKSPRRANETYGPAIKLADLKDTAIKESSGLAASRSTPGVFWTHNDSGDGPFLYAFDEQGRTRGVWRVAGATARDWEDMAAGPGPERNRHYLYIGDIGDNSEKRSEIIVYRIPEPVVTPADAEASKNNARLTEPAESIRLNYPDGKHDAEALLVHPTTGDLYVITKALFATASIYKAAAPLNTERVTTLVRLGDLKVPGLIGGVITGGDISPNGRRVALCDYMQGYEIVLPAAHASFDTIWKQPLRTVALGSRRQGEAIAYRLDGKALLATSEGLPTPLIQVVRR